MYDFLFVITEVCSLALTVETLQAEICRRERFLKGDGCEGAFALPSRGSICTVMQCTSVRYSAVLTLFSVVFNCKS